MPFHIPDVIDGTDDAREVVLRFLREVRDPMHMWAGRLRAPFDVAHNVMLELNRDPAALGPVLRITPRNGEAYLVGVPRVPDTRSVVPVALPPTNPPKVNPAGWGSVGSRGGPNVPYDLAEVTAAVGIAYALAERCSTVADTAAEAGGLIRQVSWLRDEAGELETFGVRLEDRIPELADKWRAAAGQRSSTPRPATRPVNLR